MANVINGKLYDTKSVLANRKKFLIRIGVDINKTICMHVVHGDKLGVADKNLAGISMVDYKKAMVLDGLFTDKKAVYLFLLIADCLPIIFYDQRKKVVGLIHAGWKGVDLEIAKKAIKFMVNTYGSDPTDLVVGIGPCIYKESFIKVNPRQMSDSRWSSYIDKVRPCRKGGESYYSIDLVGFTKKQLMDAGVRKDNIFESEINTAKDKRFFSHVREAKKDISYQGRFACVIALI